MKSRKVVSSGSLNITKGNVVSLDVHDHNYYMYCIDIDTGELLADCNLPGNPQASIRHLQKIKASPARTTIIYEAGNAGYSPYRAFVKAGYACKIIVPSSIPKRAKRFKTDRMDAINNLNYHCANLLRYVNIPSEEDENNRELIRYRYDLGHQISKQKQKVLALIKRAGVPYELSKSNWTKKHYNWLKMVELPKAARFLLNIMLENLGTLESQKQALEQGIDAMLKTNESYAATVALLSLLPGFGDVYAQTAALEIQDFGRFPHPNALMSYMGLIPGKHASGQSDPSRSITKAGNRFLRLAYVGAAKWYRDRRLMKPLKYVKTLPEPMQPFFIRMQERLFSRYRYLCDKGKPSNKAKCAIARELCAFTWELMTQIAPKLNEKQPMLKAA
jgi:transposase